MLNDSHHSITMATIGTAMLTSIGTIMVNDHVAIR